MQEFLGTDKQVNKTDPVVSVCVVTYNHKHFIEQCIDGILNQKTNFPFELIIGEDDSKDGTRELCINYAEKYPDKIRLFLRNEKDKIWISGSKTGRFNFIENLKAAKGKYIALCEGDDYWTDPLKLQRQVDFLETNNDYKLCFHRSYLLKGNDKEVFKIPDDQNTFKISDLIDKNNFIATCSVVFRKPDDFQIPDWFYTLPFADLALYYLIVKEGDMYCLPEFMSVYRIHEGGLWSGSDERGNLNKHIRFLNKMIPYLSPDMKTAATEKRKLQVKKMAKLKYPDSKLMRKAFVLINNWNK